MHTGIPYIPAEEQRQLQPVDILLALHERTRVNLVLEALDESTPVAEVAPALHLAARYAAQRGLPLRVVTRGAYGDPLAYRELLEKAELAGPEDVSFYSDAERDVNGNSRTRLELCEGDRFLCGSWQTAAAMRLSRIGNPFALVARQVFPQKNKAAYRPLLHTKEFFCLTDDRDVLESIAAAAHGAKEHCFFAEHMSAGTMSGLAAALQKLDGVFV